MDILIVAPSHSNYVITVLDLTCCMDTADMTSKHIMHPLLSKYFEHFDITFVNGTNYGPCVTLLFILSYCFGRATFHYIYLLVVTNYWI